ncbi:hypothetical protein LTR50_006875 [Elasticomyces elasticus]|nr:hypothetical protein LTR50_006875 [Elasticomyces elasticus]
MTARDDSSAFALQFEEIERAADNLAKGGSRLPGMPGPGRRDSTPTVGRPPVEYGGPARHRPGSAYDGSRSPSASGLQNYYAQQRFQPRQSEAEQMLQMKRRMAAQREKELRNYHQEQQYNRNISGVKSDRSMSPNTGMSEEERRDLIARQHRALYGNESNLYTETGTTRQSSQDARVSSAGGDRGQSPLAFNPFTMQAQGGAETGGQIPSREQAQGSAIPQRPRSRANSTASPVSNQTSQFGLLDNAQHSSRTSNSSPGESPPLGSGQKAPTTGNVAPIGTRPTQVQPPVQGLNKRSTTPLPSPLSYGFSTTEQNNERSTSASSNPVLAEKGVQLGGWGSNTGVWGPAKNSLGVQASVWG